MEVQQKIVFQQFCRATIKSQILKILLLTAHNLYHYNRFSVFMLVIFHSETIKTNLFVQKKVTCINILKTF